VYSEAFAEAMMKERDALRAERDRLQEALREIGNTFPDSDETPQDYRKRLQHIAHAALVEGGKP